jgi:hypothetical protein
LPPERRILIDATFPWRIAGELRARGWDSTSPHELGRAQLKDPALLEFIHDSLEPATLVTFDNKMPVEHRALLDHYGTTLAVVASDAIPEGLTFEQYWRDVIHRHAHRFAAQSAGTMFRYRQAGRRLIN